MTNQNNFTNQAGVDESNMPHGEGVEADLKSRFADYGKKSLMPLVDLLSRYKGDISPYSSSILRAFDGAIQALENNEENESANQRVLGWVRDAREWVNGSTDKLQNGSAKDFITYLEREAERNPGLMFSASYVVGMLFGRVGRYVGHMGNTSTPQTDFESGGPDEQIH